MHRPKDIRTADLLAGHQYGRVLLTRDQAGSGMKPGATLGTTLPDGRYLQAFNVLVREKWNHGEEGVETARLII